MTRLGFIYKTSNLPRLHLPDLGPCSDSTAGSAKRVISIVITAFGVSSAPRLFGYESATMSRSWSICLTFSPIAIGPVARSSSVHKVSESEERRQPDQSSESNLEASTSSK